MAPSQNKVKIEGKELWSLRLESFLKPTQVQTSTKPTPQQATAAMYLKPVEEVCDHLTKQNKTCTGALTQQLQQACAKPSWVCLWGKKLQPPANVFWSSVSKLDNAFIGLHQQIWPLCLRQWQPANDGVPHVPRVGIHTSSFAGHRGPTLLVGSIYKDPWSMHFTTWYQWNTNQYKRKSERPRFWLGQAKEGSSPLKRFNVKPRRPLGHHDSFTAVVQRLHLLSLESSQESDLTLVNGCFEFH